MDGSDIPPNAERRRPRLPAPSTVGLALTAVSLLMVVPGGLLLLPVGILRALTGPVVPITAVLFSAIGAVCGPRRVLSAISALLALLPAVRVLAPGLPLPHAYANWVMQAYGLPPLPGDTRRVQIEDNVIVGVAWLRFDTSQDGVRQFIRDLGVDSGRPWQRKPGEGWYSGDPYWYFADPIIRGTTYWVPAGGMNGYAVTVDEEEGVVYLRFVWD